MDEKNPRISWRLIGAHAARICLILWRRYRPLTIGLLSAVLIQSAIPFINNYVFGQLLNKLTGQATIFNMPLWTLATLALSIPIITPLGNRLYGFVDRVLWWKLDEYFELEILKKHGGLDLAAREDPAINNLAQKINENGTYRIQNFATRSFSITQNITEIMIAAAILTSQRWWLLPILIIFTLPQLVVQARSGFRTHGLFGRDAESRRTYWDLAGRLRASKNAVEVKLYQNVEFFFQKIKALFISFNRKLQIQELKFFKEAAAATLLADGAIAGIALFFLLQVTQGAMTIGIFTFLLTSTNRLRGALSGFFTDMGRQTEDALFASDIFAFLDLPARIKKPEPGIILGKNKTPEIAFENVTFSYPDSPKPALRNFSLTIHAGEKLAIVGLNGAGKTTMIKLLCRFYDPEKGRITVNGHDLREVNLDSYYALLATLFQDYANYYFPVTQAIAVGKTDIPLDEKRAQRAAQESEAAVFIKSFPDGYHQMLGRQFTSGIEPSAGQWQKLALARVFYRQPQLYILDEPTAAIDAQAEARIFETLEHLPKEKTAVFISHRFSTVRRASRILVIDRGTIAEEGTHEQLMEKNGEYARLFSLQAKGYQ